MKSLLEWRAPDSSGLKLERLLKGWPFPVLAGLIASIVIAAVWSGPRWEPIFHDEMAYLLQAGIFAEGRWAEPAPPIPEFFEQMHVLVTPVRAAKYPPGHSLLLVSGVAAGVPTAVPLLFVFGSGLLVVMLARRLTNGWVALLCWLFWLGAPGGLAFHASYLSEVATEFLWLAGWWALLEWWESGRLRWLLALAFLTGWCAITRPLTALLYTIPVGAAVLWRVASRRAWGDLAAAVLAGASVLALLPIWSARTTGSWRTTPLEVYTRTYLPFDRLGFSSDPAPPLRPLPPDQSRIYRFFRSLSEEHAARPAWTTLVTRLRMIAGDMWGPGWGYFAALALLGLFVIPRRAVVPLAAAALLPLGYLAYSHSPDWTVYYLEMDSVLAFLTGLGVWSLMTLRISPKGSLAEPARGVALRTAVALAAPALLVVLVGLRGEERFRERQAYAAGQVAFRDAIRRLPDSKSIVFVRYAPWHDPHRAVVSNPPDLPRAAAWIVHDRGPDNARLVAIAPARAAYLFDEHTRTISRLSEARPPL